MTLPIHIEITEATIDPQAATKFVDKRSSGATVSFVGVVREVNQGKDVNGVSYDVYKPMAEKRLLDLASKAMTEHDNKLAIYISHFQGRLDVGGISIVIAVSSPHRAEAFKVCSQLINDIKHECPIWKQEHYVDGDSEWVQGHALCQHHD